MNAPVGSGALRCELHRRPVFLHDLRQSKVGDLHSAIGKEDVARFEIVVNDGPLLLVEILETVAYL